MVHTAKRGAPRYLILCPRLLLSTSEIQILFSKLRCKQVQTILFP